MNNASNPTFHLAQLLVTAAVLASTAEREIT